MIGDIKDLINTVMVWIFIDKYIYAIVIWIVSMFLLLWSII